MLISNTMRFGTDEFAFNRQSLLTSKVALDTTDKTAVGAFTIDGLEPEGCTRRFLFKVDNTLYKFDGQDRVEYTGGTDFDSVIANGNTAAEVTAVTDNTAWAGKKIYPIIALFAPSDAVVMPTAKISLIASSSSETFTKTVESAEYDLNAGSDSLPKIVDVAASTTITGNATVAVTARVKLNDEWSDFVALSDLKDREATAIQFRATYTVTVIDGADSAKLDKITVRYTNGTATVSGDCADIYSVVQDYESPLGVCAVTIKHKRLIDSQIRSFVNFIKPMKRRTFLSIGVATGNAATFILGENNVRDNGIDPGSIQVFGNGNPIANFSYNTETSELTVVADAGVAISVNYNYDRQKEVWREMVKDVDQQPYDDGSYLTRFTYALPEAEQVGQTVSNIRLQLNRTTGRVTNEVLGTASGFTQQFVLKHAARADTLTCNASWSYDEGNQILTCVAPFGTQIVASYDWIGESQTLYSWAAGWSPVI